jgi:hypothetical protein
MVLLSFILSHAMLALYILCSMVLASFILSHAVLTFLGFRVRVRGRVRG